MSLEPERDRALAGRFPALQRLGALGAGRRLEHVQQLSAADCGAACLAMVLAYHGRVLPIDELADAMGADQNGVSALAILRAARSYGLRGRGVQVEGLDDLELVPRGAILHWEFNHFVVFDRRDRHAVYILDPAHGRRRIPLADFDQASPASRCCSSPARPSSPRIAGGRCCVAT